MHRTVGSLVGIASTFEPFDPLEVLDEPGKRPLGPGESWDHSS
jgi:hypothetical protein